MQKFRISLGLSLFTALNRWAGPLICLIAGKENSRELLREMATWATGALQHAAQHAGPLGIAHEANELLAHAAKLAATIRPDSQWTFHQDTWGAHEVIVMPRVIDSNTAVIIGPAGNPALGGVVTTDGLPPNCDPAALNNMLYGVQPAAGPVDAEFLSESAEQCPACGETH